MTVHDPIPSSAAKWVERARLVGFEPEVHVFPAGTKTAVDAAAAIGCAVAAIVKSLVFEVDGIPALALVPGDRRLDTDLMATAAGGAEVGRADLDSVRAATGFVAGGTPPFGHDTDLAVFADEALTRHSIVWGACGTPNTVFPISIADLDRLAGPTWAPLSRVPPDPDE